MIGQILFLKSISCQKLREQIDFLLMKNNIIFISHLTQSKRSFFLKALCLLFFVFSTSLFAQSPTNGFPDDDLEVGGDIFQDFNEDLEATDIAEDERFYKYSRFYSVSLGLGITDFTGNRGTAFTNNNPSFHFGLTYFLDFQSAFVMGLALSSHTFFVDSITSGSNSEIIGRINQSMLRTYVGFRRYIDTSDLGTAITYSNPYFVGRLEYWYNTTEFPDPGNDRLSRNQDGSGIGAGIGAGLEFPIEIKKSYFNVEFLYHVVNFGDKFISDFRPVADPSTNPNCGADQSLCTNGVENFSGDVITFFANYVISY